MLGALERLYLVFIVFSLVFTPSAGAQAVPAEKGTSSPPLTAEKGPSARCAPVKGKPKAHPTDVQADKLFSKAIGLLDQSRKVEAPKAAALAQQAVVVLQKMIADFPSSSDASVARFNLGVVLIDNLRRPREAIAVFRALIKSNANDAEPTGNLLLPYRNFRFHAFRMIARAELGLGRPTEALRAVDSAKTVYCSFSDSSQRADLARLDRLTKRIQSGAGDTSK